MALCVLTDLADGILARRIGHPRALRLQRRLDALADAPMFLVAPLCAWRLRPEIAVQDRRWLAVLAAAWAGSTLASVAKFGRLPLYRTTAFKWSAGLAGGTLAGRVAGLAVPFRVALLLLTLAHVEALLITLLLRTYQTPVAGARLLLHEQHANRTGFAEHHRPFG